MTSQKGWSSNKLKGDQYEEDSSFQHYSAEHRDKDWIHEVGAGTFTSGNVERSQRWSVSTWTKNTSEEGDS